VPAVSPSERPLVPEHRPSFWRDLLGYLREHKKVWLLPLVLVLLLVGVVVSLGGSPLAPLLYTLF
jgi:hypothetical protein